MEKRCSFELYCEFPANIVLSASEQEERLQVRNKRMTIIQAEEA